VLKNAVLRVSLREPPGRCIGFETFSQRRLAFIGSPSIGRLAKCGDVLANYQHASE
jgi:hypothetical protein